jgi:predicted RNase H-like nuclease (RuvC/YqgF family)
MKLFLLKLLKQLDEKLSDITKRLPKAVTSNMDVNTLLNHLTNLKTTINQKEKEIDERNKRIEGIRKLRILIFKIKINFINFQLSKSHLMMVKRNMKNLNYKSIH